MSFYFVINVNKYGLPCKYLNVKIMAVCVYIHTILFYKTFQLVSRCAAVGDGVFHCRLRLIFACVACYPCSDRGQSGSMLQL